MIKLAQIAILRGCGRFEKCVLNWNEHAIEFHESIGATPQNETNLSIDNYLQIAPMAEVKFTIKICIIIEHRRQFLNNTNLYSATSDLHRQSSVMISP